MSYDFEILTVAKGGTGASTSENARIDLGAIGILSTTTGINGSAVAATNLYTVPGGRTAVITSCCIRLTAATGLTGTANIGVGTNGTQDNIFASTTLTAFNTTTEVYVFGGQGNRATAAAGETISLGIDGAFGGTTTLAVDLIGYLL